MKIVDAHEDLAWNMLTFGRDYNRSALETRRLERGTETPQRNGDTLLGWPEFRRGQVGLVFSTLFAAPVRRQHGEWDTQCYTTAEQAHQVYSAQLDAYHRLVDDHPEHFRLVETGADLQEVLDAWDAASPVTVDADEDAALSADETPVPDGPPTGLVVLMEGAEGVRTPPELEEWWARGVRLIGPAWAGTRFCGGTLEPGPLTAEGDALLEGMAEFGFTLDLSHMDAQAALQALDRYPRGVIASHANAVALLKGTQSNRHLPDEVIRGLIERDGVIGVVWLGGFLVPGWSKKDGRHLVSLEHIAAQIDYICQMAGDAHHVGLGTDFDGGFGLQSVPHEIDTIANLQLLAPLLAAKGYSEKDIAAIFGENWIHHLKGMLPEVV
jgi:membrane dipeptidase